MKGPSTKTKLTPSNTNHASLSPISNNAETVCHHGYQPALVSRASSSPGVLRDFRNNIYKPWALGLNRQHSGNGTHAPARAADLLQRAGIYCKNASPSEDGMGQKRRKETKAAEGKYGLPGCMSSGAASSRCLHHLIAQS